MELGKGWRRNREAAAVASTRETGEPSRQMQEPKAAGHGLQSGQARLPCPPGVRGRTESWGEEQSTFVPPPASRRARCWHCHVAM